MPRYRAPFAQGGTHAIDTTMAQKILDRALEKGGDYADLHFEYHVVSNYSLEESTLKSASRLVQMGMGVRVNKGDAMGYASTEDLSMDAMCQAADTAAQIADTVRHHAPVQLQAVQGVSSQGKSFYPLDASTLELAGKSKCEFLHEADRTARAEDKRVSRVSGVLHEEIREILVASSDGRFAFDHQPLVRFNVSVIVEDGEERQSGSSGGGGRTDFAYFDYRSPAWHAKEAVRHALVMLEAKEAPAGDFPVVLAPGDSGVLLHEAVGHGLEADFNRKKTSNYADALGEQVASPLCTVVDDATLDKSRGSIHVDDEGNQPSNTVLIEKGTLRGYLHDQHSAKYFNVKPTGNGRREGFSTQPMPRMTNTLLLNGPHESEEIIQSVKYGIYAKKFGGGQVNIANGDFVFNLTESYLIEDGRITAPIKGVNLIGNGPDVMRKVELLGNDMAVSDGIWTCGKEGQSVPVGVGCPSMKISSITVGGTQGQS